jgi:hypothetical protein
MAELLEAARGFFTLSRAASSLKAVNGRWPTRQLSSRNRRVCDSLCGRRDVLSAALNCRPRCQRLALSPGSPANIVVLYVWAIVGTVLALRAG